MNDFGLVLMALADGWIFLQETLSNLEVDDGLEFSLWKSFWEFMIIKSFFRYLIILAINN